MADCPNNFLKLYKNFPSAWAGVDFVSISFDSVISLTNFTMDVKLGSTTKHFTDLTTESIVNFTASETGALDLGMNNMSIIVTDTSNNSRPFSTSIPVLVTQWVQGDQKLDTYNLDIDVTLDNTTQFTIKIETAKVSQEWVEELISDHNTSTSAHSYIQGLITTETTARQNADNVLAASINTEAGTRAAADTVLTNNLNTEIATRENADNVLATAIDTKQPLLTSENAGTGISISGSGANVIIANTQTSAVWGSITGTLSNQTDLQTALNGKQATISDLSTIRSNAQSGKLAADTIATYGNIVTHNVSEFATASQGAKADSALQPSDVVNNVTSTSTNTPLSANMGKELQDQITNLKQRGRYLSVWNCSTGLAETIPTVNPYSYKSGDYFIVGIVSSGTNYRPSGTTYDKDVPSTTVETGDVKVNDTYYYDGSSWTLLSTEQPTVAFSTLAGSPYDNSNLASALNGKQASITSTSMLSSDLVDDTNHTHKFVSSSQITTWTNKQDAISDLGTIRSGASAGATALQPNTAITAGTHSKITYDANGLVTAGADLGSSDITNALGYTPYNATNPSGYISQAVDDSSTTSTTLGWSASKLNTQFGNKVTKNNDITAGTHSKITYDSKGLVTGGSDLALSDLGITATATELNYTDGVTSNIQTQLNGKVASNTAITAGTGTKITYDAKGLVTGSTTLSTSDIPNLTLSKITDVTASATELNYCDGVTSNIQTQLDSKQGVQHYIITEDMVTVEQDDTYGVSPYNTSYKYTNITIDADAGVEWKVGALYYFVINSTMVVASAYRNVRIRIGTSGDWKPLYFSSSVAAGSSYFTKAYNSVCTYKTTYQSGGAVHLISDNNTTYSNMSASEITTGTATTARSISAKVLNDWMDDKIGDIESALLALRGNV